MVFVFRNIVIGLLQLVIKMVVGLSRHATAQMNALMSLCILWMVLLMLPTCGPARVQTISYFIAKYCPMFFLRFILVPVEVPRKTGMTRDDPFNINASCADLSNINARHAKGIVESTAKYCPTDVFGHLVTPVNSIGPGVEMGKNELLNNLGRTTKRHQRLHGGHGC